MKDQKSSTKSAANETPVRETGTAPKPGEPLLQVEDLSLWVKGDKGKIQILHDLNFTVREGERWAIAGESGAGKSMTMNALTALLPQGAVEIRGKIWYRLEDGSRINVLELPYRERQGLLARQVAVIFQDSINALNPNERIVKQWGETVLLYRPEMAKEALTQHLLSRMEIFGIHGGENTLQQYPDQLSGGMRQRIAIAMALESPGRILIADEPTTSLDAITQRSTVDFIRRLLDESGRTLLYISHNLGILQYMCDHVMILRYGSIVEQGESEKVFGNPQHPYTRELIVQTQKIMG